jgi:hypothetical protein
MNTFPFPFFFKFHFLCLLLFSTMHVEKREPLRGLSIPRGLDFLDIKQQLGAMSCLREVRVLPLFPVCFISPWTDIAFLVASVSKFVPESVFVSLSVSE